MGLNPPKKALTKKAKQIQTQHNKISYFKPHKLDNKPTSAENDKIIPLP